MPWWASFLWGSLGALSLQIVDFAATMPGGRRAGSRRYPWPWQRPGSPRLGPYVVATIVRVALGGGVTVAASQSLGGATAIFSLAIGLATPIFIERLTSIAAPNLVDTSIEVKSGVETDERYRRYIEDLDENFRRTVRSEVSSLPDYSADLSLIARKITEIDAEVADVRSNVAAADAKHSEEKRTDDRALHGERLVQDSQIREISHSLATPLAQIRAQSLVLEAHPDQGVREAALRIRSGVDMSNAVIAAYRELATVNIRAEGLNTSDLADSIHRSAMVYSQYHSFMGRIEVADSTPLDPYSNNYVLTLLLPLLENAIEAASPNSAIEVELTREDGKVFISVSGFPIHSPGGAEIYDYEYTTREGHDGIGLSTVKRLVEAYSGGELAHTLVDGRATFLIKLPGAGGFDNGESTSR